MQRPSESDGMFADQVTLVIEASVAAEAHDHAQADGLHEDYSAHDYPGIILLPVHHTNVVATCAIESPKVSLRHSRASSVQHVSTAQGSLRLLTTLTLRQLCRSLRALELCCAKRVARQGMYFEACFGS